MKSIGSIIVLLYALAVFAALFYEHSGANVKNKALVIADTTVLRMAILNSIVNPFPESDTMILSTGTMICGNTTKEEIAQMPRAFETNLNKDDYRRMLSSKLRLSIVTPGQWFYNGIRKDILFAHIEAEVFEKSIFVHENYNLNDSIKTITKEFYENRHHEWKYEIINGSP